MSKSVENPVIIHIKNVEKSENCHLLPVGIKYNGEANSSKYFQVAINQSQDGLATASFRGRPLHGDTINIPKEFAGVVIEREGDVSSESNAQKYKVSNTFDEFINWNWDRNPSANDKVKQALTWLSLSRTIHETSEITSNHS